MMLFGGRIKKKEIRAYEAWREGVGMFAKLCLLDTSSSNDQTFSNEIFHGLL